MIVGFGTAAGEDDFLGAGADECGDLFAGGFNGGAGALAGSVDRGGVGKVSREIRQHGVEDFRLDRGGGVEVEVDAVHKATNRILPAGDGCAVEVAGDLRPRIREFDLSLGARRGSLRSLVNHNRTLPLFFVSVASKGLNMAVSLLFATLAGRSMSVAAKGLKARVDSPDPVGISAPQLMWSFDGQWTVVSGGIGGDGV